MGLIIGLGGKSAGKAEASSYVVAWDGASEPDVSKIPAGVVVTYDGTSYTGTLAASKDAAGKIYLVSDGTGDEYYRYVVSKDGDTYSWVPLGSTEIDLSDYATKEAVAELEQQVSKKANKDGYYGGMTVGSAENLVGRGTVEAEYAGVRTSAGTADIGSGSAAITRMKGQSLVWNQLAKSFQEADIKPTGTQIQSSGILFDGNGFTASSYQAYTPFRFNIGLSSLIGHKLLFHINVVSEDLSGAQRLVVEFGSKQFFISTSGFDKKIFTITEQVVGTDAFKNYCSVFVSSNHTNELSVNNLVVHDLTLLFGAGNEPSTVEEFDAWRAEMGLTLDYYDYNTGEVINNKASGILTRGFNLYNPSTGKAFLPGPYSDYPHEYEICGTFSSISFTDINGNTSVPTLTDGKFFNVDAPGELTVVGGNNTDTLVHLVWSGWRNEGEPDYAFEPYWENTLNLNLTQLTGKLNGAGESVVVFPNGLAKIGDVQDEIVGNKAIKRIGVVDMGQVAWVYDSATTKFYYRQADMVSVPSSVNPVNILCGKYPTGSQQGDMDAGHDKVISSASKYIYLRDTSYTTAASLKTAVTGQLLYYELETPQEYTLDATPDWNYRVDDFGTEQVLPSYDPSNLTAPISYDVQYAMNAVDAIRRLPDTYVERTDVKQVIGQSEEYVLSQKGVDANYAKKVGVENDLVVGAAKALAGNQRQEKEFSTMVMDGADGIAKINEAMGKSVVWNNLVMGGDLSDPTKYNVRGGDTALQSDGSLLISRGTHTENTYSIAFENNAVIISGHKYLLSARVKVPENQASLRLTITNINGYSASDVFSYPSGKGYPFSGNWENVAYIANAAGSSVDTYASYHVLGFKAIGVGETPDFYIRYAKMFDLTQMFGAGNEPATVEEFEKLFPLPYYEYNEGEIISNKTQSLGVTGFNQWDPENRVVGKYIQYSTGEESTGAFDHTGFVPVIPDADYYFTEGTARSQWGAFYDADKNFVSGLQNFGGGNKIFHTPKDAFYVRITLNQNDADNTISINLSDPNRNGTYEPYKHADLPLNLSTITGKLNGEGESVVIFPDGLRSAGTVYDSLLVDEDGYARKAVKRMGKVDLGTLTWAFYPEDSNHPYGWFSASRPFDSIFVASTQKANLICEKYIVSTGATVARVGYDKTICFSASAVFVGDSAYSDAATFKSAMSGVELVYELETPETYDLDEPIPMTFMAHHGGTITQDPQAPESAPMRMNVTFALDAVSTINGLPQNYVSKESLQAMLAAMQSAGIFSGYTMTFNATTGKYEFTFTVSNS